MQITPISRSVRTLGIAAAVTATLPLCLTACSPIATAGGLAPELHASADSDLLELPSDRVYEVTETQLITPIKGLLGQAIDSKVSSSGFMTITDGVITEAQLGLAIAALPEATFVLTEPTVLRRAGSLKSKVTVVGTVSMNGVERPETSVQLTPTALTEETVAFDVDISIPDNPFLEGRSLPIDELSAHLVLTSQGPTLTP